MPMAPPAGHLGGVPLDVAPLDSRRSPLEGSINLDSLPDMDSPVKLEDEDDDTYILDIPGVRSFGIRRGGPDVASTAPPKLQAIAARNPNHDVLPPPKRLDFSPIDKSIVHSSVRMSVKGKGKRTAEENLMDLEQANDRDTFFRLYTNVLETVSAQVSALKLENEKCRKSWKETLEEKEGTIFRLKNEIRISQDDLLKHKREIEDLRTNDLLKHKREIEDLKTQFKRETEDLKDALLQQNAAKDSENEDLKAALAEQNIKIAGMTAKHEREIEILKASNEDRHRTRLEKLKSNVFTAFNNYSSVPESASVQFTQVSLCKQEEKDGDSGNHGGTEAMRENA